jgi:diaminopimelate decarboxylase
VLDVRKAPDDKLLEIVVDACIAELPLAHSYTHRIFHRPQGNPTACQLLKKGRTRVLGRICMEDDILSSGLELPEDVAIGDFMVFGDAGGYERSMSYVFGRG